MTVKPNILVVGGTNRNLGKTEFICGLLRRFSGREIIVIKIKTLYPDDLAHHGRGTSFIGNYVVREESCSGKLEDSKRFLAAGAYRVFYIKSHAAYLGKAFKEALAGSQKNQLFIVESNSIMEHIRPGAFILLSGPDNTVYKPSSLKYFDKADIVIKSTGNSFETGPEDINLSAGRNEWSIQD